MPTTTPEPDLDRRGLCACALALVAATACSGGGGGTTAPPAPPTPGGSTVVTTTDTKAGLLAQPAGTVRDYTTSTSSCPEAFGAAQGVYLVRDGSGIFAVSASCLHLGGRIQPGSAGFSCACHGSRYDLNGTVTVGPAPVGAVLDHFEVREASAGGALLIDTSKKVAAGTRLS